MTSTATFLLWGALLYLPDCILRTNALPKETAVLSYLVCELNREGHRRNTRVV